jgi:hypothetical protein
MWTEVVFEGANASSGIAMAHELRSAGLTLDQDFTWHYIPSGMVTLNNTIALCYAEDYHEVQMQKKQVIIQFRNPALATFYSLKWQR